MRVVEVKAMVHEWMETYGQSLPGFRAAHFMGSINQLTDDASFPAHSDVDMSIVHDGETRMEPIDLDYKGVMIEYGLRNPQLYETAEKILASSDLAPQLVQDSIIVDPHDFLRKSQPQIAREYKRRKWVQARVDNERQIIDASIAQLRGATNLPDALLAVWNLTLYLGGAVTVAALQPPTHRKSLVRMKEVLAPLDELELHEAVLQFFGCADVTPQQARTLLNDAANAFDFALSIKKTPAPFDFKLKPHLRPYFYEGSLEMIDAGYHREAAPWIAALHATAIMTIQIDAEDDARRNYGLRYQDLLMALDLAHPDAIERRKQQVSELAERTFKVAGKIVAGHPEVVD